MVGFKLDSQNRKKPNSLLWFIKTPEPFIGHMAKKVATTDMDSKNYGPYTNIDYNMDIIYTVRIIHCMNKILKT